MSNVVKLHVIGHLDVDEIFEVDAEQWNSMTVDEQFDYVFENVIEGDLDWGFVGVPE